MGAFSETQKRFLRRHLSVVLAPLLVTWFALLSLPYIFYVDPRERQAEITGKVQEAHFTPGGGSAMTGTLQVRLLDQKREFVANDVQPDIIPVIDRTIEQNEEVSIMVSKSALARTSAATPLRILALSAGSKDLLVADKTAAIMAKYRWAAFAFFIGALALNGYLLSVLRRRYAHEASLTEPAPGYDELILFFCEHPYLCSFVCVSLLSLASSVSVPADARLPFWIGSGLAWGLFAYWFRGNGESMRWFQDVREYNLSLEAKRRAGHVKTEAPKHVKAVQFLLDKGVDINIANEHGQTPLHIAISVGSVEGVGLLLTSGSKLEIPDADGQTPLMLAAQGNSIGIVMKLLDHGANVLYEDPDGTSILEVAEANKKHRGMARLIQKAAAEAEARIEAEKQKQEEAATRGEQGTPPEA